MSTAMAVLPTTTSLNRVRGIGISKPGGCWWRGSEISSTWDCQTTWLTRSLGCLAGLGLKHRRQRRLKERLARRVLVLSSSEFEQFFEEGPTELAHAGTPASGLRQAQQGRMCKEWVRKVLQERHPEAEMLDPDPGFCCNGSRRGSDQAEYDFLLEGQRVKAKSSKMAWSLKARLWTVEYLRVRLAYGERAEPAFDDLYLVILSPKGLHLIKHDLVTGVSTRGRSTEVGGHIIKMRGSTGTTFWKDALDEILEKLCVRGGCSVVAEKTFSELNPNEVLRGRVSRGQAAVAGLPMSTMSKEKRGKRIQEIGLAIDRKLHPGSKFSFPKGNRGKANASANWVRGSVRVELKSSGLTFHRANHLWQCHFHCIKTDLFDELRLAIYSCKGIHFYSVKSLEHLQLSSAGAATIQNCYTKVFYGPRHELDPLEALKAIQAKMALSGCELVAIVEWEKGSSTPRTSSTEPKWGKGEGVVACSCTNAILQKSSQVPRPYSPLSSSYQAEHYPYL